MSRWVSWGKLAFVIAAAIGAAAPAWAHGLTERVSVGPGGSQGNGDSFDPAVSADGRLVAFTSAATNLVSGDTNGVDDVFVRDLETGVTKRVSVGPGGIQGNAFSGDPQLSADARFVAFTSAASNLVPGDTNGTVDVFVRDRQTGTTRRVSIGSKGGQADQESYQPALSADGRFVAFNSLAGALVPSDTNDTNDVFVRDRWTGTTKRVSVGSGGIQGDNFSEAPALSADGRFVAFRSYAVNLVPGDTNGTYDVFVRDRRVGTTRRVSIGSGGAQGNLGSNFAAISANGRLVAFDSSATNLVPGDTNDLGDVFVHDLQTGTTRRVNVGIHGAQGNNESVYPVLSADGRLVAFDSSATNLVRGDTNSEIDVFLSDLPTGTLRRVSVGQDGAQGNNYSANAAISANGRFVAFASAATNLVPHDTNGAVDVFIRVLAP